MNQDPQDDMVLGEGKFVRLVNRQGWEFIDHPGLKGIVVVVAVTAKRELLLVEQYRAPLQSKVIELPAGMVGDKPGHEEEPFGEAAQRELVEETGYSAERFEFLTEGPASPGRSSFLYTFFRAYGVQKTHEGGGDETEDIRVYAVPLDGIDAWLRARAAEGILIDPKIYAGLYFIQQEKK